MILYKNNGDTKIKRRSIKNINISIEEKPERPKYIFTTNRDRVKFIKTCESVIRGSMEYKEYISFLKNHMDMDRCAVLTGLSSENGRKYSIEIHHGPFNLFEIVDTVLTKRESLNECIDPYSIAEEVMKLHFDEMVGLIPLSITMHELVHNDKIFIPLQYYYQRFDKFYDEYEEFVSAVTKGKIDLLVEMSMKCDKIQSDILDPEFVYINVEGFEFPEIPEEWGVLLQKTDLETTLSE